MKKIRTYKQLEAAVEKIAIGAIYQQKEIERLTMKCFTDKMRNHKAPRGAKGGYSPKFKNGRGCAIEIIRNLFRFHDLTKTMKRYGWR